MRFWDDDWCVRSDVVRSDAMNACRPGGLLQVSAQTSGFGLWTSDVGGYTAPPNGNCDATNSSYRELVTRWFQFGACCPIFRQHGYRETEVWKFGPEAEAAITTMIKWRTSIKPCAAPSDAPPFVPSAPLPPPPCALIMSRVGLGTP